MARIQKSGLNFFSFDVDFFNQISIKALKATCGPLGIIIYLQILSEIYSQNYYIKLEKHFFSIMADEWNINLQQLKEIIGVLCDLSLIDRNLYENENVITSADIQRLYQLCMKSRRLNRNITADKKYWLLDETETESIMELTSEVGEPAEKNKSTIIQDKSTIIQDKSTIYAPKERKEKESKGNEIKESKENKEKECAEVIEYLNQKAGTDFALSGKDYLYYIKKRFLEGYNTDDFKKVIDKKCADWQGTDFAQYLRPQTLFGDKFEIYVKEKKMSETGGFKKPVKPTRFTNFEERRSDLDLAEKQKFDEMIAFAKELEG